MLGEEHQRPFSADAAQRHNERNAGARHIDLHFAAQILLDLLPAFCRYHSQQHRLFGLFQPKGESVSCTAVPEPTVRILTVTPWLLYSCKKPSVERRSVMVIIKNKLLTFCLLYSSIMASSGRSANTVASTAAGCAVRALRAQLRHQSHHLHGDQRSHGNHRHHAKGVGDDIAAHRHAGTLRQR